MFRKNLSKAAAVDVFRHKGWLARTPAAFREEILRRCDVLHLRRGQSAYEMGDEPGGLYGVSSGRLDVHLPSRVDAPSLTWLAAPGFWTGDIAAVTGTRRQITLIAGADSRVLRLSRASMIQIVEADPQAWLHFAELLARNFATALSAIALLRLDSPIARICALLAGLAVDDTDPSPTVRASQAEIAAMTQLGKTAVNASLSELEAAGVIQRRYASVRVLDIDRCRSLMPRASEESGELEPRRSAVIGVAV